MMILSGHIQPYLDAIVSLYNTGGKRNKLEIPKVVRVQTGENINIALSDEVEVVDKMDVEEDCTSDDEFEELVAESASEERSIDYLKEGAEVAYDFGGNGLVRGKIVKCLDGGWFVVRFANNKSYKFPPQKTTAARENFESELKKLTAVGMDVEQVKCMEETVGHSHHESHLKDEPILRTDEDTDEAEVEKRYEVKFHGNIPRSIVGFELDNFHGNGSLNDMEPWEYVINGLAQRRAQAGELTTRQLHNLAKAEWKGNSPKPVLSSFKRQKTP